MFLRCKKSRRSVRSEELVTTATATRTAKKSHSFRLAKNKQLCRCITLFCTLLCRRYKISTLNFLISRFMVNVNIRQRFPFFFGELRYSPLEFNSWKIVNSWQIKRVGIRAMKFEGARIHFLGDVFSAVAVVVEWRPNIHVTNPIYQTLEVGITNYLIAKLMEQGP